jgi:TusA-related sulfurtransferase
MLIDARRQGCPKPVMMAEEALSKVSEGIVDVLVDNEDSALNVAGFAAQNGMFAETMREGTDWKIKIVKGYGCETTAKSGIPSAEPEGSKKSLLLIVGTDILGREEKLGKTLIKAFFETMKV